MWTENQIRLFIGKRREDNDKFHDLSNNMKCNFWRSIASEINIEFGTVYSGRQCKDKFNGLV